MTARRSKSETGIPLFLILTVIARQIKEQGEVPPVPKFFYLRFFTV